MAGSLLRGWLGAQQYTQQQEELAEEKKREKLEETLSQLNLKRLGRQIDREAMEWERSEAERNKEKLWEEVGLPLKLAEMGLNVRELGTARGLPPEVTKVLEDMVYQANLPEGRRVEYPSTVVEPLFELPRSFTMRYEGIGGKGGRAGRLNEREWILQKTARPFSSYDPSSDEDWADLQRLSEKGYFGNPEIDRIEHVGRKPSATTYLNEAQKLENLLDPTGKYDELIEFYRDTAAMMRKKQRVTGKEEETKESILTAFQNAGIKRINTEVLQTDYPHLTEEDIDWIISEL